MTVKIGQIYKERGEHRHVTIVSLDGAPERVTIMTCSRDGIVIGKHRTTAKVSRFDGKGYQLVRDYSGS